MVMPYAQPLEQRHSVPKCNSCGWVGPWQVEPVLLPHHIIIFLVLLLAFGGGLIYLVIILIVRSSESSRAKICPNCGARNMHTFVYADAGPAGAVGYGQPAPAQIPVPQYAGQPVAGTMMAPAVGGPGTVSILINGTKVSTLSLTPGGRYTIGRAPGSTVLLGDPMVSSLHAVLAVASDGSLNITDAGSSNGTFVNGHRLSGAVTLGPAEVTMLGSENTKLTVEWN